MSQIFGYIPFDLNYLAVLTSVAASFFVGFLWYSPILFGKPWMKLVGYDVKNKEQMEKMKKAAIPAYAGSLIGTFIMAFVLANIVKFSALTYEGDISIFSGALTGFWIWVGFVAPVQYTEVLFAGKSVKLWVINTSYQLVTLILMAIILTAWR